MGLTRRQLCRRASLTLSIPTVAAVSGARAAPESFEPLGSVAVESAADAVASDGIAYVATLTGFAIVDVSEPTEPTVLADQQGIAGDHPQGPLVDIQDVALTDDGNTLVVAGPANRASDDQLHGLVFFDVSDPSEPEQLGEPYETESHIHNCTFDNGLCYYVGNDGEINPLVIVDLESRTEVGRWSLLEVEPRWADVDWRLWYLHDVFVHEEIAYLPYWNAGTYLLDVSDPSEPDYLSHVAELEVESQLELEGSAVTDAQQGPPGNDHTAVADENGTLLAVGRETWALEAGDPEGASGIELVDVTDPTAPDSLTTIEPPPTDDASFHGGEWTTAHNFELRNDHLYASWYQGGVTVHDVSDPREPVEVGAWRDTDEAAFWTAQVTGDVVIGSSTPQVPTTDIPGALYTFPDVAQTDQPVADDTDSIPGFRLLTALAGVGVAIGAAWQRQSNTEKTA